MEYKLAYVGSRQGHRDFELGGKTTSIDLDRDSIVKDTILYYDLKGAKDRSVIKLSQGHARVSVRDGKIYVADLGSLVGTYINGETVGSADLSKISKDWKKINFDSLKLRIKRMNAGERELKVGDVVTLGKRVFGNVHQYKLENAIRVDDVMELDEADIELAEETDKEGTTKVTA